MAFCTKCGKELPPGATFCPACGTPVQGATAGQATPVSGIDALTRDSKAQDYWIRRLIAFGIDAIIVYVVLYVLVALFAVLATLPAVVTGGFAPFAFVFGTLAVLGGLIFVLYFSISESSSGASVGKRVFRLKVVSRSGGNPTFMEALIRNFSKIYLLLLLLDVIVGLALSKNYQQKYSDQLAGTSVTSA